MARHYVSRAYGRGPHGLTVCGRFILDVRRDGDACGSCERIVKNDPDAATDDREVA